MVNYRRTYEDEFRPTELEQAVGREIQLIAKDEIVKHEAKIREAIIHSLTESPTRFKINAYSEIEIPKSKE